MDNKTCSTCKGYKNCRDSAASWFFFIIGIIATVAIRAVTVLLHLAPIYAKISWYVGVVGFFLFFIYKFLISQRRARTIHERGLVEKIQKREGLTDEDYEFLGDVFCNLASKKERINFFLIFGLSIVALLLALYMDFFVR